MPLGQIMGFRAGISGLLIPIYGPIFQTPANLVPKRWRPHILRGALACIAFARLPIAQAPTYLAPLLVAPIAMLRLGEQPTARLLLGLAFGFTSVLSILALSIETGACAMWGAIAGIAGAGFVAIVQVDIRAMIATETPISISLAFTLVVATVTSLGVFAGNWSRPIGPALWILLAAGVFGALNPVLFAESLALAPASTVALWIIPASFGRSPSIGSIGRSSRGSQGVSAFRVASRSPCRPCPSFRTHSAKPHPKSKQRGPVRCTGRM